MLALRSSVPDPRLAQPPAFPASTAPLIQEGPPLGLAARLLLVGAMLTLAPVETVDAAPGLAVPGRWMITPVPRLSCDTAGNRCCRPDAEVPTLHCLRDLGCNVGTGRCEPCGAPDQVCCDGTYTGFSGRSYTGPWLDPGERVTSCNAGAACDSRLAPDGAGWVGSRRCVGCGTREGAACCPPDVRYALGRCSRDVANGIRLVCDDPWAGAAGHCVRCGWRVGDPACATEGEPRCNPGMVESGDRCVFCGSPGSPPCDDGCHAGSAVLGRDGLCVAAGGLGQPCLSSSPPCLSLDTSCNAARICAGCGKPGQPCCPDGSPCFNSFCQRAAEGNRCTGCGYDGSPACPGRTPCPHGGTVVSGWCRPCGKAGQACCRGETIVCESHPLPRRSVSATEPGQRRGRRRLADLQRPALQLRDGKLPNLARGRRRLRHRDHRRRQRRSRGLRLRPRRIRRRCGRSPRTDLSGRELPGERMSEHRPHRPRRGRRRAVRRGGLHRLRDPR